MNSVSSSIQAVKHSKLVKKHFPARIAGAVDNELREVVATREVDIFPIGWARMIVIRLLCVFTVLT